MKVKLAHCCLLYVFNAMQPVVGQSDESACVSSLCQRPTDVYFDIADESQESRCTCLFYILDIEQKIFIT